MKNFLFTVFKYFSIFLFLAIHIGIGFILFLIGNKIPFAIYLIICVLGLILAKKFSFRKVFYGVLILLTIFVLLTLYKEYETVFIHYTTSCPDNKPLQSVYGDCFPCEIDKDITVFDSKNICPNRYIKEHYCCEKHYISRLLPEKVFENSFDCFCTSFHNDRLIFYIVSYIVSWFLFLAGIKKKK